MALNNHIVPDSPTNNFCTLNPLNLKSNQVLLESNLRFKTFTTNDSDGATSTVAMPNSGKYYIEVVPHDTLDYNSRILIGVTADPSKNTISQNYVAGGPDSYSWTERTGVDYHFRSEGTSFLFNGDCPTFTVNAIYQIFYDSDNLKIWMGKNNNWYSSSGSISGTPNFSTDQTMQVSADLHQKGMFFIIQIASELGQVKTVTINFGQDPTFAGSKSPTTTYTDANGIGAFYYQPPTGAKALCTANLPDFTPTVTDDVPQDYFKAVKYVGDYSSPATISVGFNPDLVWIKQRTPYASQSHCIYDSVRGVSKRLSSDSTSQEITPDGNGGVTNFSDNNGFELTRPTNAAFEGFDSSMQMIAWCWKAGGAPDLTSSPTKPFAKDGVQYETLSAANITAGTITPTAMSVNTDAGFSIIKWVGNNTNNATIPHGLTKEPDFVIIKNLIDTTIWIVKLNPNTNPAVSNEQQYLYLNLTNNFGTNTGEETQLTTNTIKFVGTSLNNTNGSGDDMVAYCWHSVEGYSAFGSYEGSTALPFVYTGFRPSLLILKNADDSTSWVIHDSARDVYNEVENVLVADAYSNETTYSTTGVDFLSNGFKLRGDSSWYGNNLSTTQTVIFMAFAEQPFKYANAR